MPLLKYTLFAGASLLALVFVAERVIAPAPAAAPSPSTSLEVLRKMANHGAVRGFAPLAAAGPFLPMPAVNPSALLAEAEPVAVETPAAPVAPQPAAATVPPRAAAVPPSRAAGAAPSSVLNAHARVAEADLIDRPTRAVKKVAPRKPRPRPVYVENIPRGQSGGFFGLFNTW